MHKHYIGTAILGIIGIIVIILGITLVGSPSTQQLLRFDEIRLINMNDLSYKIESYYTTNKALPTALSALPDAYTVKDPKTKKDYEYKVTTTSSYQLCAEFGTDSKEIALKQNGTNPYTYNSSSSSAKQHKKGFDCITYNIASYNLINQVSPTPLVSNAGHVPFSFIITKPQADETLCLGKPYIIRWKTDKTAKGISLSLYSPPPNKFNNNTSTTEISESLSLYPSDIQNSQLDGSYSWIVGKGAKGEDINLTKGVSYSIAATINDSNYYEGVGPSGKFYVTNC